MVFYIISQVLVFLGTALDLIARLLKSKKWILVFMVIASSLYVASYIFISSPLAAIINAINMVRTFYYIYLNEKNKPLKSYVIPIVLTVVASSASVAIFWQNAFDLFMIASLTLLAVGFASKNLLTIRIITIVNASIWVFYNLLLVAYVSVLCNVLNIVLALVAIILYDVLEPRKKKKLSLAEEQMQVTSQEIEQINENEEK